VGANFFYHEAADLINVIESFKKTRQAAGNITGQEFGRSLILRLNGVVAGAAKHQETILVGATNLGQKLKRLTHACLLERIIESELSLGKLMCINADGDDANPENAGVNELTLYAGAGVNAVRRADRSANGYAGDAHHASGDAHE
jgi:hypothetical protein